MHSRRHFFGCKSFFIKPHTFKTIKLLVGKNRAKNLFCKVQKMQLGFCRHIQIYGKIFPIFHQQLIIQMNAFWHVFSNFNLLFCIFEIVYRYFCCTFKQNMICVVSLWSSILEVLCNNILKLLNCKSVTSWYYQILNFY